MKIVLETDAKDDAAINEMFELLEIEMPCYEDIRTDAHFQGIVLVNAMMVGVRERLETLKYLRDHKVIA